MKKYLPPNKQFLITRNVPCGARVSSLENVVLDHDSVNKKNCLDDDGDDDDDWLVSRILTPDEQRKREMEALEREFDILDEEGEVMVESSSNVSTKKTNTDMVDAAGRQMGKLGLDGTGTSSSRTSSKISMDINEGDNDEYADMDDFEDENVMQDEAAAVGAVTNRPDNSTGSTYLHQTAMIDDNRNILTVRSYNVSITYDKYYQTPRVWLSGYADDGSNRPLTGEEIMEDVISDYAHRTVTMEYHPHLSAVQHASIHPCQHGAVMKTIIKNLMKETDTRRKSGGGGGGGGSDDDGPSVEMYLFIFLKFVSSMIPTISYDFTVDVSASTRK